MADPAQDDSDRPGDVSAGVPSDLVVRILPLIEDDKKRVAHQQQQVQRRPGSADVLRRLQAQQDASVGTAFKDIEEAFLGLIGLADLNAARAQKAAKRWSRTHYYLGLPAALTATLSGATGLASVDLRVEAAIIALISAALAAAVTFLASQANRDQSNLMSASWSSLADDTRLELYQVAKMHDPLKSEEGFKRFVVLKQRKDALLRGSIPVADTPGAE